jgi:putative redox protein
MRIEYGGGMRLVAHHRGHTVPTDQPAKDGGNDGAVTPTELFIASLGTCPLVYVLTFAKRHGIPMEGLTADVEYEIADRPRRVGSVTIRINLPEPVSEPHRVALQRAAEQCLVHNTLQVPPEVRIEIEG